ncbi:hypothetical protein RRG08_028199 [Elysia crispata]|uniref:Uncharacterized protein n=1 Tax=Elysia crispata TaxID=231223 RepID=A0AAE1B8H4_9GAST|nr:hypothetical protein RRG08_028199 [Elysia crispata]
MERAEVSAEVHFAQKLASNEKKIRDRAIKRLRLTENDVIKIWKGLHYCMWMQDKPLLQEELSQKISGLLQSFSSPEGALLFMKVFLETEAREWNGIDKLRLDKFMMMIRDMLHQSFTLLSNIGWPAPECRQFAEALALKVMLPGEPRLPDGLKLHLADIYIDELLKVSLDKMSSRKMVLLLRPFIDFLVYTSKTELAARVMQEVLVKALNTVSTVWRCTPISSLGGPDSHQDDEDGEREDEESDEKIDISGGGSDVGENIAVENLSNFVMDADLLLFLLFKLAKDPKVKAKNRAMVYKLVKKYPETYDNIVNTFASSSDACIRAKDDLDGGKGTLEDLTLFHNDGQGGDQHKQQKNKNEKRKKDKNNSRKEGEGFKESIHAISPVEIKPHSDSQDGKQLAKTSKKGKVGDQEKKEVLKEFPKPMKRKRDIEGATDCANNMQQSKFMKFTSEELGTQLMNSSLLTPKTKSKKKKKKSKTSKEQDVASSGSTACLSPNQSNLSDHQNTTKNVNKTDKNSNSQGAHSESPRRSSTDLLMSPVEMVIYPKKTSAAPKEKKEKGSSKKQRIASVELGDKMHLVSSSFGEPILSLQRQPSRSPSPSSSLQTSSSLAESLSSTPSAVGRKKSLKKGRKSASSPTSPVGRTDTAADSVGDSQAVSGFSTSGPKDSAEATDDCPCKNAKAAESEAAPEVKSVFSSIKEKYVDPLIKSMGASQSMENSRSESSMDWSVGASNVSAASDDGTEDTISSEQVSQTDPGPNRKKAKCQLKGDNGSMTPCGKKKVFFDLRKNRANKFQDYIKSLQRQPDSPHMPEKSPSNSILKSTSPRVASNTTGKKKYAKGNSQKSPKNKKNQKGGSRSPSPSPRKLKVVRSRSNFNVE